MPQKSRGTVCKMYLEIWHGDLSRARPCHNNNLKGLCIWPSLEIHIFPIPCSFVYIFFYCIALFLSCSALWDSGTFSYIGSIVVLLLTFYHIWSLDLEVGDGAKTESSLKLLILSWHTLSKLCAMFNFKRSQGDEKSIVKISTKAKSSHFPSTPVLLPELLYFVDYMRLTFLKIIYLKWQNK